MLVSLEVYFLPISCIAKKKWALPVLLFETLSKYLLKWSNPFPPTFVVTNDENLATQQPGLSFDPVRKPHLFFFLCSSYLNICSLCNIMFSSFDAYVLIFHLYYEIGSWPHETNTKCHMPKWNSFLWRIR